MTLNTRKFLEKFEQHQTAVYASLATGAAFVAYIVYTDARDNNVMLRATEETFTHLADGDGLIFSNNRGETYHYVPIETYE